MLPFERRSKIIEALDEGIVYISELASALKVSEITIRRDLKELESESKLVLLHGGAAKKIDTSRETVISERHHLYAKEKDQIGKLAADLVNNQDVIFIDSGTTNITMIKFLVNKDVTIVTNGLGIVNEAIRYNVPVTSIGGNLKKETMAFIGAIATRVLDMYTFDKCFLGVNGIDKEFGYSNADPNESIVKEHAMKRSKQTYIMADYSKFDDESVFKFADLSQAIIITNQIPEEYKDLNIEIITNK